MGKITDNDICPSCGYASLIGDSAGGLMCYMPKDKCGYVRTRLDIRIDVLEGKINEILEAIKDRTIGDVNPL